MGKAVSNDFKALERQLSNLNKKFCNIDFDVDFGDLIEAIESLQSTIENQTESVEPTLYCDEDCNITGAIAYSRPEDDTSTVTPIYFDSSLQITTVAPTGKPCSVNCQPDDYEFKFFEEEKCTPDGTKVKEVLCIVYINGVETGTETFWIIGGLKTLTQPTGLDFCIECSPAEESFYGDSATLALFNEISIFVPKCCELTIETSLGEYTIPSQPTAFLFNKKYDCFISDFKISSSCDIDDVYTILTKTK